MFEDDLIGHIHSLRVLCLHFGTDWGGRNLMVVGILQVMIDWELLVLLCVALLLQLWKRHMRVQAIHRYIHALQDGLLLW